MGTDVLPALSRLWVVHLDASLATWRVIDGLWSSSLDACFLARPRGIEESDCYVELESARGGARGQRFREAEDAIRGLALGLRGGKVHCLEAMIQAIDRIKEQRSSCRHALERPSSCRHSGDCP